MKLTGIILLGLALSSCFGKVSSSDIANEDRRHTETHASPTPSSPGICSFDFSNSVYPWPGRSDRASFSLVNGKFADVEDVNVSLDSIYYGDATKDGVDEAIVTMGLRTGGSAIPNLVYVFGHKNHSQNPEILWKFESGDRASGGLRNVYTDSGELVVETYNDTPNQGDCCPQFYTRRSYRWDSNQFTVADEKVVPNPVRGSPNLTKASKCKT